MFEVTSAQATTILTSITSTGNALIGSLVMLAGVFIALAGLRWVLGIIRSAMHVG